MWCGRPPMPPPPLSCRLRAGVGPARMPAAGACLERVRARMVLAMLIERARDLVGEHAGPDCGWARHTHTELAREFHARNLTVKQQRPLSVEPASIADWAPPSSSSMPPALPWPGWLAPTKCLPHSAACCCCSS